MFRTCISSTPFTTNAANSIFPKITGDAYGGDVSFLATLRVLLPPRIGDDSLSMTVWSGTTGYINSKEDDGKEVANHLINSLHLFLDCELMPNAFYLIGLSGSKEKNGICISRLREHFADIENDFDWVRVDKISALYKKAFETLCFIDPKTKTTVMFVDNLDYRKFHYLQCCIPGAIPWYFDETHRITEDEFKLIDSLRQHESEAYEKILDKLSQKYDFRSAEIKSRLSGFETKFEEAKIASLKEEIEGYNSKISEYMRRIGDICASRESDLTTLYGLETKVKTDGTSSEIMEYFLCNKSLYLNNVSGTSFTFSVKSRLVYFNEDMVERILANKRSYAYRHIPEGVDSKERMYKLLKAIFIDEVLKIHVCASFSIDLLRGMSPVSGTSFDDNFKYCMPNPHINNYACMGNYVKVINTLFSKRDYIGMIEQCIASAQSLNWGDTTVMDRFMELLAGEGGRDRCIELPDGNIVKPAEAIKWIEEQEGTDAEKKEKEQEETNE